MLLTLLYLAGFIRTALFLLLIFFIVRWISRLLSPQNNSTRNSSNNQGSGPDGETTIRYNKKGKKIVDKNKGEYVDFEEVE